MKSYFIIGAVLLCSATCPASETDGPSDNQASLTDTELLSVNVKARADWQNVWQDGDTDGAESGFEGKYLMLRLDGRIIPGLTYSWRQRFNKSTFDGNFFDSTDWLEIKYDTGKFDVSAGKQIVAIGGWEYDRNPVDIYSASLFWMNVGCYEWGVSGGWHMTPADHLTAQVTQSMFHTSKHRNLYAYNLLWNGRHGVWHPLYSVNLTEYEKGRYINYIVLGNHFDLPANLSLEADLINRYARHQKFGLSDCSVIAELAWRPHPAWRLHAKYTYDVNRSGTDADLLVLDGTELNMAGGGVEFMPLRRKRTSLRLHANCYGSWGANSNDADLMRDKTVLISFGVSWDMDVFHLNKKDGK